MIPLFDEDVIGIRYLMTQWKVGVYLFVYAIYLPFVCHNFYKTNILSDGFNILTFEEFLKMYNQ